jgi:hypothetical protein
MARVLADWPDPRFIDYQLTRFPAPVCPSDGRPIGEHIPGWVSGLRLHGTQERVVKEPYQFKQFVGGWRVGKSFSPAVMILMDLLWRASERGITNERWGVVGDTYEMATEELRHLHNLLETMIPPLPHNYATPQGKPHSITFMDTDQEVVTLSASDVTKIASKPYRGFVIAEANQTTPTTFTNAMGRVLETGGWVLMEGTLEQTEKGPWYAQRWREWQEPGAMGVSYSGPSWDNQVVFPLGREDPRIKAYEEDMLPNEFREKICGEPSAPADAAVPEARKQYHVVERFPALGTSFDPELPVELAVDPGSSHAYACLAIQSWGNQHWVIDAIYRWNRTTDLVVREAAGREWAENVRTVVMDRAAKQHNTSGEPDIVQWRKLWPRLVKGNALNIRTAYVPLGKGYSQHRKALLNCWPEDEAQRWFNADGALERVVNPDGPRLYFSQRAAAPFFGGFVDGVSWGGEYLLHHNRRNRDGIVTSANPVPLTDDAIKALNYWFFDRYDPASSRLRQSEQGAYAPRSWSMVAAG